jgi:hypothetical protein
MQSAPDHDGERQERLRPRGIWEQDEGGTGGAIANGVNDGHDELGRWSWSDGGVRGGEGRGQYCRCFRPATY